MLPANQLPDIFKAWAEIFTRRSMHDMKRFMDEAGLSPSQVTTLLRLSHGGECGVSDIGDHVGITNAAASQMLERLLQQGFIERIEDSQDRRAKRIFLTQKGRALVDKGIEARHAWLERAVNTLTQEQQDVVASALKMLTEAARKIEEDDRSGSAR